MSPLRAIMVDLDGTLAHTAAANVAAYAQALSSSGVIVTAGELELLIGGRHWTQFLPAVLAAANSSADPARIAAHKTEIYAANLKQIEINTGLVRLLEASRMHLKTALVTSASRASTTALLAAHDLTPFFDVVVTGDDVENHKPHPEAYHLAAEQLHVQPGETLIYEDSDIGVASAKAFGGHVIRVVF